MDVLVTGGAGFIGSHIVERLVRDGHRVRVLDNLSSGRRENLAAVADDVELVVGDVRDAALLRRVAAGCELVFHQAAIVSVPYSVEHPGETQAVNLGGTLNVLEAARAAGARRVVFASSAAIYGDDPRLPKREEMLPTPISPYGVEKIGGEHYMRVYHLIHGLETVCLRYFNVFGPRQDPGSPYSGVISIFVRRALAGEAPTIYGDGRQTRDFVYVADGVAANLAAAATPGAAGKSYNDARGERTALLDLVAILGRHAGRPVAPAHAPPRPGDIVHSQADIARARAELGYAPAVTVEEGLRLLLEHERAAGA